MLHYLTHIHTVVVFFAQDNHLEVHHTGHLTEILTDHADFGRFNGAFYFVLAALNVEHFQDVSRD